MKKSILISITAALLLAAVLCTAGCVTEDRVVGTYVTETDSSVTYAVFENNGTGYFATAAKTDGAAGLAAVTFDYTVTEPNKTYTLTFADNTTETAVLDAERGLMAIGGVEYQECMSMYSGTSKSVGSWETR